MSIFSVILLLLGVSQLYWGARLHRVLSRRMGVWRRWLILGSLAAVWVLLFEYTFGRGRQTPVDLTWGQALLVAPFLCWAASSLVGFLVALILAVFTVPVKLAGRPKSPSRRRFLERGVQAATAAPFVAGAYGLLYGRLNLETTSPAIRLPGLPAAFEGFRICQLSDIHIGPFMPFEEIRRYVAIANALKPDLIVLTGDFVTFDPSTQEAVVRALSSLRAPFGVYGSLGNHDAWTLVEDSITRLFAEAGIRILRGASVPIRAGADSLNLIGVDFQSRRQFGPSPGVANLLGDIEDLVARDRVNILLSHNPDTFDRAAELRIELSLAGHTHGGQAALEFISPQLAPSRLVTPYVSGHFQKPGGQLYVNRGIGTIGVPIRLGAPPEITVYKLTRG
jgi:predicted MPP superfamily phosphohydrolase